MPATFCFTVVLRNPKDGGNGTSKIRLSVLLLNHSAVNVNLFLNKPKSNPIFNCFVFSHSRSLFPNPGITEPGPLSGTLLKGYKELLAATLTSQGVLPNTTPLRPVTP